jgi:predicted DNA binding CopG/RHH family protein
MQEHLNPPRQPWETVEYTDDPDLPDLEYLKPIKDFLPRPEELVLRDQQPKTERVSMVLDKATVDFFRQQAKSLGAPYQRMIRKLLNEYVKQMQRDDKNLST